MKLGKLIRKQRESLGLTQDQVAARAGISKPYLSNIETGRAKNPPSNQVLDKLERSLEFESGALRRRADIDRTPPGVRAVTESAEAKLAKIRSMLKDLAAGDPATRDERLNAVLAELGLGAGTNNDADAAATDALAAGRTVPVINRTMAGYPHDFTDLDYPPRIADEYVRCPDVDDPQAFAARVVGDSMTPEYRQGDIIIFAPNTLPRSGQNCFVRFAGSSETTFRAFYLDEGGLVRLQPLNPAYPPATHHPDAISGVYPAIYRIERLN